MEGVEVRNQIIKELYDSYTANGFITEDEALSLFTAHNVPLHQIDALTEQLLVMGVIIVADSDDDDDNISGDRSRTDYDAVYSEVLELYSELEPIIEYIRNIPRPMRNEWQKLMPQAQHGNAYAKNRLYEMYLRVAVRQALQINKEFHMPLEDMLQDGFVGAISSVDNYDSSEHNSYATTIQWRISQGIHRNKWIYNNPAYFPIFIREKVFSIMEEVETHHCERCPADSDNICAHLAQSICDKHEWSLEEAITNIRYLKAHKSLDELCEKDEEKCDGEKLLSDHGIFADELYSMLESDFNRKTMIDLLNGCKPREKDVLILRFGFSDRGVLTLEEIGNSMNITRERVRQIEAKALRKIRKRLCKIWGIKLDENKELQEGKPSN